MVSLVDLWLPILLSAVLVFVASTVIHMVLQLHNRDYRQLPDEAGLLAAMRERDLPPGQYVFPRASSMKEMSSPEMLDKYRQGPVGFLSVVPAGIPAIGKNLLQWFVYSLVIGAFVGYIAGIALPRGAEYGAVFRLTGTAAILGYALSYVPESIWKGLGWSITARFFVDGVVYGLVTAGTFGWLWPGAGG